MSGSIDRALRIIAAHPNVVSISNDVINSDAGTRQIDVAIRLGLPNAWVATGHSPNGVRSIEPVTFRFPANFPLKAPTLHLRADFDRSLAHVRPGGRGDLPEPCIFEGNLTELLPQQGIAEIINQLVVWLENAALERLINPAQGWEPVRRDRLRDFIVADAAVLRGLVSRKAGYAAFGLEYWSFSLEGDAVALLGEIGRERLTLNAKTTPSLFTETQPVKGKDWRLGRSLAIVSWPGRHASGELVIADRYQPETVTNIGSLFARAEEYGCEEPLRGALQWLETCLSGYEAASSRPIVLVLCARRPFHIIGSESAIELCPYITDIGARKLLAAGDRTAVRPAGHRHSISVPLLRRLSSGDLVAETSRMDTARLRESGLKDCFAFGEGRTSTRHCDRWWRSEPAQCRPAWIGAGFRSDAASLDGIQGGSRC